MHRGAILPICRSAGAAPRFPLKAADFIARGLSPGPDLGAAMRAAEAAWIAADFVDDAAALEGIVERVIRDGRASEDA